MPRPRHGFTLIELLVVIAIIAVLMALIMPAVQAAREAARRSRCSNNLKQIGLGFHHYHEVHNVYPVGGYGGSLPSLAVATTAATQSRRIESWGQSLLPYIEQSPLYDGINHGRWYLEPQNTTASATVLSVFLCPSNQYTSLTRPDGDNSTFGVQFARNDYSGNYGERALRCYPATACANNYGGSSGGRGMLLTVSEPVLSVWSVIDGTTYTIMAGEAHEAMFGYWASHKNFLDQSAPISAINGLPAGTIWGSCQVASTSPFLGKMGCDFSQEFAAYHSGGAYFVFADGSARFVRTSIVHATLAALLSRRGFETLSGDSF